jgi:hypothetical protein
MKAQARTTCTTVKKRKRAPRVRHSDFPKNKSIFLPRNNRNHYPRNIVISCNFLRHTPVGKSSGASNEDFKVEYLECLGDCAYIAFKMSIYIFILLRFRWWTKKAFSCRRRLKEGVRLTSQSVSSPDRASLKGFFLQFPCVSDADLHYARIIICSTYIPAAAERDHLATRSLGNTIPMHFAAFSLYACACRGAACTPIESTRHFASAAPNLMHLHTYPPPLKVGINFGCACSTLFLRLRSDTKLKKSKVTLTK